MIVGMIHAYFKVGFAWLFWINSNFKMKMDVLISIANNICTIIQNFLRSEENIIKKHYVSDLDRTWKCWWKFRGHGKNYFS